MIENDPLRERRTVVNVDPVIAPTPVVETPVANPVVDPVSRPVLVEPAYDRSPNPFPYIAGLVLLVLGLWGLFAFNSHDRDDVDRVAYVQQDLDTTDTTADRAPLESRTTTRASQDRIGDDLRDLRAQEVAGTTAADRLDTSDRTVTATQPFDDQVATVDLSANQPASSSEPASSSADRTTATQSANTEDNSQSADTTDTSVAKAAPVEVAVQDLDYSDRDMAAMTEQDLQATMTQLDADLDATQNMARDAGQMAGLQTLEQRFKSLQSSFDDVTTPIAETDRLRLTRQLSELRDELAAFQTDVQNVANAE
jgi:hypothetical protein